MRLASYNVENLFDRAKAMNLDSWEEGRPILEKFAALEGLLGQVSYSDADRRRMTELIVALGLEKSDIGPFVLLRRNRGALLTRPKTGGVVVTADGRADWVGSLELREEPVDEEAMRNTARVMNDVNADVLGIVEVESRPALSSFNSLIVPAVGGDPFAHVMVIDGNDERGIDVGLMTRKDFPIGFMRSHVDDRMPDGSLVFSRDCAEYRVTTPAGATLVVLVNHFKSKGYGGVQASDARRRTQAKRAREIYEALLTEGVNYVALIGDLNDFPDSQPLKPLTTSTLKDAFTHPDFDDGGYPGTYGLCNTTSKIDYLFLSPTLFDRVQGGGVFRRGLWPGSRPKRWDVYPELTAEKQGASDHAAVWVDLDI
ncbi:MULTISPECIES: endonuclease/exonuclease/phosphatase family protein [Rhizobium]|uniref:Endonuclease/exonuclease/phosphatase family metal-dependent hydrolase n=1 Tax=Rhizobium paranaense TaxID=1650438 RepID=A0A7W8XTG5_9HYPH|nr:MULTISPECIES: endonuclease/exonuclease/phosphatase family protein [Rhizobium]MBB5575307.1 endonuclease/exonuclease/phosphatase family metal-dependent hydrolase [Rhizobium paranaense]PST64292.1 endonuclease/exonuclease/phosphatase [Rhizobium sp. SEMIA4064]